MEEVEIHSMAAQETVEEKEIVSRRMKELEKSLEEKERVSHEWYCSLNVSGMEYYTILYSTVLHVWSVCY